MSREWEKLDEEWTARILDEINPSIEPVPFNLETTSIRKQELSFYNDHDFYELTDMSAVPSVRKYAIYKPGDVNVINWTNQAIYDVNEKSELVLNDNSVGEYVKFFFSYVRGRHGRFIIVEKLDDIKWQKEPPEQGKKVINEMLKSVSVKSKDDDGTYNLEGFMVFKDSLFKTDIHVKADGMVSLSNEELKIEGMPVISDVITA